MKKIFFFFAAICALSACDFPDTLPPVFDTNTTAVYINDGPTAGSYILSGNITLSSSYNWNVENSAPTHITLDSNNGSGGVNYLRPQLTDKLKALLADPDKHFTLVAGEGYLIATLIFSAPSYAGSSHSVSIYYVPTPPIPIRTKEDLMAINDDEESLSRHYILMESIDLQSAEWTPIGSREDGKRFTGSFNGNGYHISNLKVRSDLLFVGLFGCIDSDEGNIAVQDLQLVDVDIEGDCAGAVAGYLMSGIIQGCSVTGVGSKIAGVLGAGGIAGFSDGSIQNCSAAGAVNADGDDSCAGGIAGFSPGSIQNCSAAGAVNADGEGALVGGIAGYSFENSIQNCFATGAVSASGDFSNVGGIVGFSSGSIQNCYAMGAVSASGDDSCVGGIVGSSVGGIQDCVALNSSVSGNSVGRVVGAIDLGNGTFSNNYGWEGMIGGSWGNVALDGNDGADVDVALYKNANWWKNATNWFGGAWDFTDTWAWGLDGLPVLR